MRKDKALLFDLDGTLLPMNTDLFIQNYISSLSKNVAHVVDPKLFVQALLSGTDAMMKNLEDGVTNERVFEEVFLKLLQLSKDAIWPTLDQFYETEFPKLSTICKPTPTARKVVEAAIEKGFTVAIATNPLFPKVAIFERLKWANIADLPFEFVTVYEENCFTKPHTQYYQEICQRLNVDPKNCIMVGNDIQEDMVASKVGMKTFLVEGFVIDRGEPIYPIDEQGTLEELLEMINSSSRIFSI